MLIGFEASALQGHKSGVGYYTENMISSVIASCSHDNFVLFSSRDLASSNPVGEQVARSGRLQYDVSHFPVRAAWMQTVLPAAIRRVRPDVCHFTNYLAPLQCACPYVVTIYDMTIFMTPRFHTFKKLVLDRTLIPLVARRASTIITVSNSAREDILRYLKVPKNKVKVITGAASSHFRPITDAAKLAEVKARYGITSPYILYVGTIEPRKNLLRLVQAFSSLKGRDTADLKLRIVGQQGWYTEPLYAEIKRLGLEREVIFTGYVPSNDLPSLYTLAECMAFPSVYEGFGLPVIEAMACGVPVVTSRTSSLAEVAGDAALLVDPLQVSSIEEALVQVLADVNLRTELRQRGIERAASFTWEASAQATIDVYKHVHARSAGVVDKVSAPALY